MNDKVDWSNESPEFMLTYDDFREYYTQLIKLHERCGDECIHLKRFYNKMGNSFIIKKSRRSQEIPWKEISCTQ